MEPRKNEAFDIERRNPLHFTIGLVIAMSLVMVAFEWKSEIEPLDFNPDPDEPEEYYMPPVTRIEKPEPPKPAVKPKIEIPKPSPVVNFVEREEPVPVETKTIDSEPVDIIDDPNIFVAPVDDAPTEPFLIVESMPEFKGGEKAFLKYLAKETRYPRKAANVGAEGKIYIEFVINEDGSISDVKILKGLGFGCDEEAIRVLLNSPKWEPGKQRGRPVKVKKTIQMNFTLR